jgi:hypothetical protein
MTQSEETTTAGNPSGGKIRRMFKFFPPAVGQIYYARAALDLGLTTVDTSEPPAFAASTLMLPASSVNF